MGRDLTGDTLVLSELTAEEHGAALYVCAIAKDLDDARRLLDALGLNDRRPRTSKRRRRDVHCVRCGRPGTTAADRLCARCYSKPMP
jgi:hypothetical protein